MTVFPEVQRKLRQSIHESMPELEDRPPTFEDLTPSKLPYLEAVVQETLRLSRTAGGYSRDGASFFAFRPSCLSLLPDLFLFLSCLSFICRLFPFLYLHALLVEQRIGWWHSADGQLYRIRHFLVTLYQRGL